MKNTFVLILISLASVVSAQEDVNPDKFETDFSDFKPFIVDLPSNESNREASNSFQPRNVTVLDYRFDTTTLGFINKNTPRKRNLVLELGTCAGIERFLKQQLPAPDTAPPPQYELVMVLQKLWLSDDIFVPNSVAFEYQDSLRSGVVIKVAYFLKEKNAYFPLYRFDTTIVDTDRLRKNAGEYLANALNISIQKLGKIKVDKVFQSGKKYDFAYINDLYKARFKLPVLLQRPKKGVYLTFEEFKKNQPSVTEYSLKSDKKTDNLYYKDQSGQEVLLRNLYAFSDGIDFFLWSDDNFYRLYRSGNAFNLYAARNSFAPQTNRLDLLPSLPNFRSFPDGDQYTKRTKTFFPDDRRKKNVDVKLRNKMRYYQLDMETGVFN